MLPWLSCLPHNGILAPFRTNQTIGLLLILGYFAFYFFARQPLAGGIACVLLATQPALVTYSRASMSDLSGAAAALLAFALVYLGMNSRRRGPIYGAGVVLGLSLCIRPQLIFFAPLLISMALFPVFRSRGNWLLHCVLVLATFALAASPYFVMNAIEFGNPLKTGYDFWVPSLTDNQVPFSLHNVPRQAAMLWSEATANWKEFRVSNLFGTGTYFVPAFVLLAFVGGPFCRLGRFTGSALLAGTTFFFATATYSFVDGRFYMPVQFLLVAVAALPVEWAMSGRAGWLRPYARVAILMLFVMSCLGYPSESGYNPRGNRSQAWDALHYQSAQKNSPRYAATKNFSRTFEERPGIVLSNIDPVYLNALLPETFVAAPMDEKHSYCYSRLWHYGSAEAAHLAVMGLSRHLPAYALLFDPNSPDELLSRLPSIDGFLWKSEVRLGRTAVVLVLTPAPSRGHFPSVSDTRRALVR